MSDGIDFQNYAVGPNKDQIWVWDLAPDREVNKGITLDGTLWEKNGRWAPGDPSP